jgi:hypothetical protein
LNHGKLDDRPGRIFSEKQSQEMWSPQTIFPIPDPSPRLAALKSNFSDYGLGWMLREYRGHRMVTHGGGVSGFVSNVVLNPTTT